MLPQEIFDQTERSSRVSRAFHLRWLSYWDTDSRWSDRRARSRWFYRGLRFLWRLVIDLASQGCSWDVFSDYLATKTCLQCLGLPPSRRLEIIRCNDSDQLFVVTMRQKLVLIHTLAPLCSHHSSLFLDSNLPFRYRRSSRTTRDHRCSLGLQIQLRQAQNPSKCLWIRCQIDTRLLTSEKWSKCFSCRV